MRLDQCRLDGAEIEDQLVGIGVSRAGSADLHALHARQRRVELAQHEREILPVGLARIASSHRLPFPTRIELACELGTEALGDR